MVLRYVRIFEMLSRRLAVLNIGFIAGKDYCVLHRLPSGYMGCRIPRRNNTGQREMARVHLDPFRDICGCCSFIDPSSA